METCENCGKPATMYRGTSRGDMPSCDRCLPGDWTGEAKPLVDATLDLSERVTLSKAEAARLLGVSHDHFERHILPDLRSIQSGARVLIPRDELEAWSKQSAARALKDR